MGCDQSKPEEVTRKGRIPNGRIRDKSARSAVSNGHVKNGHIPNGHAKGGKGHKKGPGSGKVHANYPPTPRWDDEEEKKKGEKVQRSLSIMLRQSYGKEKESMIKMIRDNVIGIEATFDGPFGRRKVIYCDFVASGKPVKFIEEYITNNVLPFYANTHTTTTVSALQTSTFREEAREIIKYCVNATDEDVVIFTGSGSTAAIHKLINALQLKGEKAKKTAVIIGPYEHHSNILPWRVSGAKIYRLKEAWHEELDLEDLREKLQEATVAGLDIIVALSAASNVTGIKTDPVRIAELVHEYGGLSFWDYACAGPYLDVNMNPTQTGYKDAAFVSVHKFLGGPGSPGVLIAKKNLFQNSIPGGVGGGTVAYVSKRRAYYISNIEEREEGGTPAIVESIRAGLAFQLKQEIGSDVIEAIENNICKRALNMWKKNTHLQILGSHTAERLPIFSILITHPPSQKFLHHNFVSAILNDIYGIQARGGCACAGPYAMDLLCITDEIEDRITVYLEDKDSGGKPKTPMGVLKPGFARLNFPYFYDKKTVDYVIKAVDRVATDGWKLMPLYKCDAYSGSWEHRFQGRPQVAHLTDAALVGDKLRVTQGLGLHKGGQIDLQEILDKADKLFEQALELSKDLNLDDEELPLEPEEFDMVWFLQPRVALMYLRTPGLKYFNEGNHKLLFAARRNTLVNVRKKFINALGQLGHDTTKLSAAPTFYAGDDREENNHDSSFSSDHLCT